MLLFLSSCGEYYEVIKSGTVSERYSFAKKSYNEKKYERVVDLLKDLMTNLSATSEGPQCTYLMADSYYNMELYTESALFFQGYYKRYPKAPRIEDARYKAAYSLYMSSPDARLDQSQTVSAIKELQAYLDYFPKGKHVEEVEGMLIRLQDKLAYKEYLSAELYFNLGLYLGNNYRACVVTAQNALKEFPYCRYREDLIYLIFKAKSKEAELSVLSKQQARLRDAIDQYYIYLNSYPKGRYLEEAKKIYEGLETILVK